MPPGSPITVYRSLWLRDGVALLDPTMAVWKWSMIAPMALVLIALILLSPITASRNRALRRRLGYGRMDPQPPLVGVAMPGWIPVRPTAHLAIYVFGGFVWLVALCQGYQRDHHIGWLVGANGAWLAAHAVAWWCSRRRYGTSPGPAPVFTLELPPMIGQSLRLCWQAAEAAPRWDTVEIAVELHLDGGRPVLHLPVSTSGHHGSGEVLLPATAWPTWHSPMRSARWLVLVTVHRSGQPPWTWEYPVVVGGPELQPSLAPDAPEAAIRTEGDHPALILTGLPPGPVEMRCGWADIRCPIRRTQPPYRWWNQPMAAHNTRLLTRTTVHGPEAVVQLPRPTTTPSLDYRRPIAKDLYSTFRMVWMVECIVGGRLLRRIPIEYVVSHDLDHGSSPTSGDSA